MATMHEHVLTPDRRRASHSRHPNVLEAFPDRVLAQSYQAGNPPCVTGLCSRSRVAGAASMPW